MRAVSAREAVLVASKATTCSACILDYLYFPKRGNIKVVPAIIHSPAGFESRDPSLCELTGYIHFPVGEGGSERVGESFSSRLVDSLEII